jgi:hypothetical protein
MKELISAWKHTTHAIVKAPNTEQLISESARRFDASSSVCGSGIAISKRKQAETEASVTAAMNTASTLKSSGEYSLVTIGSAARVTTWADAVPATSMPTDRANPEPILALAWTDAANRLSSI